MHPRSFTKHSAPRDALHAICSERFILKREPQKINRRARRSQGGTRESICTDSAWKGFHTRAALYFPQMFSEADVRHHCWDSGQLKHGNKHTKAPVPSQKENKTQLSKNTANFSTRKHLYKHLFLKKKKQTETSRRINSQKHIN